MTVMIANEELIACAFKMSQGYDIHEDEDMSKRWNPFLHANDFLMLLQKLGINLDFQKMAVSFKGLSRTIEKDNDVVLPTLQLIYEVYMGSVIHPLHTQDVIDRMDMTLINGYFGNSERRTGRSTAIALHTIAKAIENPRQNIHVVDHHPRGNMELAHSIKFMIEKLGLKYIQIVKTANSSYVVKFGD